ncbi:MAG: transposase [Proteobacteria bacterium]|nr:transposase [Pseudomonadota bacterium]
MKKRFTDEQIVIVLQEAESGGSVRDICRKHNVTEQTFYRWRKQFDGMEVADVKKLKALHQENEELKKVVAELTLDNRMLRDINSKKW